MNEFSMELNSLGRVTCVSLNDSHLSPADKKLAATDVQSLDVVRWLLGEMARSPVEGTADDHDPANNPRFTTEELTAVTDAELDEFAEKLVLKNKYLLLKTHKGSDIEKSVDESSCNFLARAFRHCAKEEKAATARMIASASHSLLASTTVEAMQRNLGVVDQRAFRHYAASEAAATERMAASISHSLLTSTTVEAMQRNLGVTDLHAFRQYADAEAAATGRIAASASHSLLASTAVEVMQRNLGVADQHAFRHYAASEAAAAECVIASTSQSMKWADYSDWNRIDRFSTVGEALHAQVMAQQHLKMYSSAAIDQARSIAELAQTYTLHAALDPFRTAVEPLASKLLHLQSLDTIKSSAYLDAFMQASTISDIFTKSKRVDHQLQEAMRQFSQVPVPTFATLNVYRQFLDSAGLGLPRWPHLRLLTVGEKRRRLRAKLNNNVELAHVKKAKSLVHRYELTLRDILDGVMANEYGEEWAVERLTLCDCKDLLGKWEKRGGEILDHADYAHYERIMSYPEHFEAVFEAGFDDLMALAALIKKAGTLRAALHHFHPFSPEDLRDLRLIWRTIETGLLALTDDYDFEH